MILKFYNISVPFHWLYIDEREEDKKMNRKQIYSIIITLSAASELLLQREIMNCLNRNLADDKCCKSLCLLNKISIPCGGKLAFRF